MNDLLKKRMSAAQQATELEVGNEAYARLFPAAPIMGKAAAEPRELPIDSLRPFFTADIGFHPYPERKLKAFSQQLAEQGIYERILVRPIPGSAAYEILAGHNRTEAWKMAGHSTIPAEIVEANDAQVISIATATNLLRRQDLTIIERGKAYQAMLEAKNRNGQRNAAAETFGDNRQRYNAREIVADFFGVTEYEIRKAIKLAGLIPPLAEILENEPRRLPIACAEGIADYDAASQRAFVEMCSIHNCGCHCLRCDGTPFFGERGIDRLHCETAPDLLVQMAFADETGTSHELARSRRGERMTITYDGCEVRQKDLAELFGEKDAFLSIFNPLYFIEELGEDGKRLLERYLPSVRHEEVLAQLGEPICTRLAGEELLSPEVYLRNKREEIRTLEKELTYTAGQRDAIAAQRRDSEQESVRLNREIAALESELKTLEQRRCEGLDMAALEETLMETSERYSELLHEPIPAADTEEVDNALREVQAKRDCRLAEVYQPKYAQPVLDATAKVKELGGRYKRQTALLKGFRAESTCPACLRTVSEQELPAVQAALRDALTETVAEGKNVKAQLAELTALEAKAEAVFLQFKKENEQTFTERCQELARQRESLVAAEKERAQQ